MGLSGRFKKALATKDGTLRYPTTVLFDVDQYKAIEQLKIGGCKSFGSKVRYLVGLGLKHHKLTNDLGKQMKSSRKTRESS